MSNRSVLDSEPGPLSTLLQARMLLARGLVQIGWTLLAVCLLAAAALGLTVWRSHEYAPRFLMRVVEEDRDPSSMPRPRAELADYVRQVVFTSEPLFELIRRHGLYPTLMRKNPRAALDSFREDISVDVYRNYFVEERAPGARPRSARLAVSFRSKDPALALSVTRELGALIVEHERRVRREQAEQAAALAAHTRDLAERALTERNAEILEKQARLREAKEPDPREQVELVGLLGSLGALERQAGTAERRAASLGLGAAFERRGLGLRFELIDDAALSSGRERQRLDWALAGCAFALGLPLVTMAVGAFHPARGET